MPPTNAKQLDLLVSFMETNPSIAKNYLPTSQAKAKSKILWNALTEKLNACGPPAKTMEGWKTVWKDFRYNLKRKMRDNFLHLSGTGGGPFRQKIYSENEKIVIAILDLNEAVSGNLSGKQFGDPRQNEVLVGNSPKMHVLMEEWDEEELLNMISKEDQPDKCEDAENVTASSNPPPPLPKKKTTTKKRDTMLEQHVQIQEEVLKMLSKRLTSLENTQKAILKELQSSNRWSKEADRRSRKMFELKKEKFEELKKNNIRKNKMRLDLIEIKAKKLELRESKMGITLKSNHVCNESSETSSDD